MPQNAEPCESLRPAPPRPRYQYWIELVIAGRLRLRLSSRALAAKAGLNDTSVNNLEIGKGRTNLSLANWRKLLAAAEVPFDLAGLDLTEVQPGSELYQLVLLLQRLPSTTTSRVLALVQFFAEQQAVKARRHSKVCEVSETPISFV